MLRTISSSLKLPAKSAIFYNSRWTASKGRQGVLKVLRFFQKHTVLRVILAIAALWIFGSLGMWLAESQNSAFESLPQASWNLMVYLTSGFEGDQPMTTLGKLIGVIVVVLGLGLVGVFTATIASVFVERTLREGKGMGTLKLSGHIVICGWNKKAERIVREIHAPVVKKRRRPIVIINREGESIHADDGDPAFDDVYFIAGDPSHERVLTRANVFGADAAIVLADRRHPEMADAHSILIALAIEAINPDVHTCVEVLSSENLKHFDHTKVDECISVDNLGELMLSQSALSHGISDFFTELLTFQEHGNEVYHVPVPASFVGQAFEDLARTAIHQEMIAVGIRRDGRTQANPSHSEILKKEDEVLIISRKYPELEKLKPDV
jgi:voltage-gated potassium channel